MSPGWWTTVLAIVVQITVPLGALIVLGSAVVMLRERDAISRINGLGPTTSLGLPLIVIGGWLHQVVVDGWNWTSLARVVVTVLFLISVSAIGTGVLARAAYQSGAPVSSDTSPNDLANDPEAHGSP